MKNGFTIVELMVTIALLLILFGISSITLLGTIRRPAQAGAYDILASDLKSQQTKSMMGRGEHGITFSANSYVLTPDNFTVDLPDGFEFTTTPQLIFSAGSGETTDTAVSIRDVQSGEIQTLRINKHGATY